MKPLKIHDSYKGTHSVSVTKEIQANWSLRWQLESFKLLEAEVARQIVAETKVIWHIWIHTT